MKKELIPDVKYFYKDNPVPRVTTIISTMIHEEYLMKWANYLGFKHQDYVTVTQQAFDTGTVTHERIEQILHGDSIAEFDIIPVQSFWMWYKPLKDQNIVETIYTEKTLVCQLYGGTLDAVLKINGRTYLVDFKTSKHVTYKYFLQLAAYRKMLRESEGMELDGVIILQVNKVIPSFNEYVMNFPEYTNFMDYYEQTFINLTNAYYNILYCQDKFNTYLKTLEK